MTQPNLVLAGRLEAISLPDVLQLIANTARNGVLTVESEEPIAQGTIEVSDGRVVGAELKEREQQIGSALLRRRALDPDLLGEAVRRQAAGLSFRPLDTVLVEMGAVEVGILAEVMVEEIEARVAEILGWKRGVFRFRLTPEGADRKLWSVALDPQELLLEAARRVDEAVRAH